MSKQQNTSAIALCGVMLAVVLLLNFLASFHLFRIDAILYLISGALVYFVAQSLGLRIGIVFYAAAAILSFVLLPDKAYAMFFIGVFGPGAIINAAFFKAESSEHIGRTLSAVLSVAVFIILFSLFAFLIAYGGGFLVHLNLPMEGTSMGTTFAIAFGAFSSVVAYIVNRNLADIINRRISGAGRRRDNRQYGNSSHIDLPKLYNENEE